MAVDRSYAPTKGSKFALSFVCLLFPMIPVTMIRGCGQDLFINVLLWLLGLLPGVIHGIYIVWKYSPTRTRPQSGFQVDSPKVNAGDVAPPTPIPAVTPNPVVTRAYSSNGYDVEAQSSTAWSPIPQSPPGSENRWQGNHSKAAEAAIRSPAHFGEDDDERGRGLPSYEQAFEKGRG